MRSKSSLSLKVELFVMTRLELQGVEKNVFAFTEISLYRMKGDAGALGSKVPTSKGEAIFLKMKDRTDEVRKREKRNKHCLR